MTVVPNNVIVNLLVINTKPKMTNVFKTDKIRAQYYVHI